MPVADFDRITGILKEQGYKVSSEVDHPVARMAYFDTYQTMGVATEIMGVMPEGGVVIEPMKKGG